MAREKRKQTKKYTCEEKRQYYEDRLNRFRGPSPKRYYAVGFLNGTSGIGKDNFLNHKKCVDDCMKALPETTDSTERTFLINTASYSNGIVRGFNAREKAKRKK